MHTIILLVIITIDMIDALLMHSMSVRHA